MEDVVTSHRIDWTMCADDPQLYVILKQSNRFVGLEQLKLCIDEDLHWNTQKHFATINAALMEIYLLFFNSMENTQLTIRVLPFFLPFEIIIQKH